MKIRYHPDGWIYVDEFRATLAEVEAVLPQFRVPPDTRDLVYEIENGKVKSSVKTDLACAQRPGPERWNSAHALADRWPELRAQIEQNRIPTPEPTPDPDPELVACREIVTRWDTAKQSERERVLAHLVRASYGV
jgi:hypothetical protein